MLEISVLGETAIMPGSTRGPVTEPAQGWPSAGARGIALIAFLVVHAGIPQRRQRIAGLFWPDSTDAQALTNLRRELHHLRRLLDGDPALEVTATELCWRGSATCRVDLEEFTVGRDAALAAAAGGDGLAACRAALAAVEAYRGALLAGFDDDWALAARSELERQCVELCDLVCRMATADGADLAAASGDLGRALRTAQRRVELRPLEEVGYRDLMRLQAEAGDRAGAVGTYHRCASVLEQELGLDPDPATHALFERLISRRGPGPADALERGTTSPTVPGSAPLIGREAEWDRVLASWRAATTGRPAVVLVRGDPGVGKSRLVADLAAHLERRDTVVAVTECFSPAGRLAFSPVTDWLRHPAVRAATARLDPVWRTEVARLVPPAGMPVTAVIVARAKADAWKRLRFFEGLARALLGVRRPALLVIDDLQWCDQETLDFIAFLLHLAGRRAPLMVLATARADSAEPRPAFTDWLTRLRSARLLTEVPLAPLSEAEVERLAAAISGHELTRPAASAVYAVSGGFPLFVVEAARAAAESSTIGRGAERVVPAGDLAAVLRGRIDQLSPAEREIVGLAAAIGGVFDLALLTEAADLPANDVVIAVDQLWRRRILRQVRGGYDFTHDLVRDTAYTEVSPARRWLMHRRLAQALELLHAADADPVSAQVADQYARGGSADRAARYYRRAAEVVAARFGHAEAIRLHGLALTALASLPESRQRDREELQIREAMAAPLNAHAGYASPDLRRTLERSIALAESLGSTRSLVTALLGLWSSEFVAGRLEDSAETAARALALAKPASEDCGNAHFGRAGSLLCLGRPEQAVKHFAQAATMTRGATSLTVGTRADVHGPAWAAHALWLLGRTDDALVSRRKAIELARASQEPYCLAVAIAYGAITDQLVGDRDAVRRSVIELGRMCDRYGFAYYRDWGVVLDGWCRGGDDGLARIRDGISSLRRSGSFARMPYWLSLLADTLSRAGYPAQARAVLDAALVSAEARSEVWWTPEILRRRARHDEPAAAADRLRVGVALARAHGSTALRIGCENDLAALTSAG